ncbi:MAG: GvpL/GvpF family gas vesicle protein [Kofleriaceae bacterium]|nr:GvpL/GvpF family gas vesicle protein [Kofleriaceae bacterium]
MTGTIIYCIGRKRSLADGPPIRARGLGGGGVRLIPYQELVAVVGDATEERYQVSRANVRAHSEVIDEVMERSDVLPLRFGEVAPDDEEARKLLLEQQYDGLLQRLDRVRDRVELALRVSFDEARLFDEIRAVREDLVNAGQRAASFEDRVSVGQSIAQVVDNKRERASEMILAELEPLAVEVVTNELTSDMMVLNAAFLVDRSRLQEFDERVRTLGERETGRLVFRYVGPLPPYSFVDLRIPAEAEEAEAVHA